jgi:hypothetical protein
MNDGATTTSVKTSAIARAASSSASRPNATMPPNALTVSVSNASAYAAASEPCTAAPHGWLCLMMATLCAPRSRPSAKAPRMGSALL